MKQTFTRLTAGLLLALSLFAGPLSVPALAEGEETAPPAGEKARFQASSGVRASHPSTSWIWDAPAARMPATVTEALAKTLPSRMQVLS